MPLFITTTNEDIAVNSFKTRGYPICFNKSTDYREIYIVDPSNDTKYIYDGHGTRMTIGAQNNTGRGTAKSSTTGNGGTWLTQYETAGQVYAGSRCSYSIEGTGFARVTNTTTTITIDCNLPIGTIIMWGKTSNPCQTTSDSTHNRTTQFPKGWYVCNGSNGTPNLSDKFIKATTTLTSVGTTGGSHTKTLLTANLPSHAHTLNSHTHTINHDHASFTSGGSSAANTGSSLTTHTHTINHDHASFTSGGSSAANTGSSLTTHTHTINHDHASFTSGGSSAANTGSSLTTHVHAYTHNHTSVAAGFHAHRLGPGGSYFGQVTEFSSSKSQLALNTYAYVFSSNIGQSGWHGHSMGLWHWKMGDNANSRFTVDDHNSNKNTATNPNFSQYNDVIISYRSTGSTQQKNQGKHSHSAAMYGSGYHNHAIHNGGGDTSAANLAHTHTMAHTHSIDVPAYSGTSGSTNLVHTHTMAHTHSIDVPAYSGTSGSTNLVHTHTMAHTHSIDVPAYSGTSGAASGNTGSIGSGSAFDIQPAYYQVVFIMRIS